MAFPTTRVRLDQSRYLINISTEAQEDAAASRIVRSSTRALKEGREFVLPKAVADRLANGDNAVRVKPLPQAGHCETGKST